VGASGGGTSADKQNTFTSRAADLDAAYLQAGEHRVDARPSRIFHSHTEIVDTGYRTNCMGTRRIILGLIHPDDNGAALRIGESYDLAKQVVAGVCSEITPGQPRIRPTTLTRNISLKFEERIFINSISA